MLLGPYDWHICVEVTPSLTPASTVRISDGHDNAPFGHDATQSNGSYAVLAIRKRLVK